MAIDVNKLRRAMAIIDVVDEVGIRTGVFVNLCGELQVLWAVSGNAPGTDPRILKVLRALLYVQKDLWNIETLFDRLSWQHAMWVGDHLPDGAWLRYAAADIDMLHVEARSLCDYLAQLLRHVSDKPATVPDKSFDKLRKWATTNKGNRARLGEDVARLFDECDWFSDLRNVRDDVVHRGAETLVFLEKPNFCFQTYQGTRKKVFLAEVMANKNVVDFERYAGVIYGYILAFLESVAETAYRRLQIARTQEGAQHRSQGAKIGKAWIEKALDGR